MLYIEEQPLDLSTKGNSNNNTVTQMKVQNKNFDMEEFYRTYYAISVRSWNIYQQPQHSFVYPLQEPVMPLYTSVKRKLSEEFEEIAAKKMKAEVKAEIKEDSRKNKMTRRKRKEELSLIKQSCDCRSCYENHINKLRVKSEFCAHS